MLVCGAGLVTVPFRSYVKMADGAARRVLSFVPGGGKATDQKPDPAVLEWARFRGRVVVYTSTFNRDWTEWPVFPSFLEFQHELLVRTGESAGYQNGDRADRHFVP